MHFYRVPHLDPITHKTLHNDSSQAAGMACALNGVNPWVMLEGQAGFQFLNFAGASGTVGMMINLFTFEVCFYVRGGGISPATAIGLYYGASGQVGFGLGPAEGKNAEGIGWEGFIDSAVGEGVSGKALGGSTSGISGGASVGATAGAGFSFGIRTTYTKILYCINSSPCSCNNQAPTK